MLLLWDVLQRYFRSHTGKSVSLLMATCYFSIQYDHPMARVGHDWATERKQNPNKQLAPTTLLFPDCVLVSLWLYSHLKPLHPLQSQAFNLSCCLLSTPFSINRLLAQSKRLSLFLHRQQPSLKSGLTNHSFGKAILIFFHCSFPRLNNYTLKIVSHNIHMLCSS